MFRANNFDKLLDKATSNLRLDPDWPTILQICDLIRQNDCSPKYAVAAVKKKLYSQNPHQAMFSLLTLESMVKNCGSGIHDEVTSKGFCEMLRDLVKTTQHENLRTKILELIQAWAFAFRNAPKYRSVQDTVNILKAEGFKFPTLKESDAMFSADTAPEWADGEVCHRCRTAFSLMVRRHHCRACGQVFCQQCSSKTSTLPKFGIEKEVRVCDACYDKVSRPPSSSAKLEIVDTANDYGPSQPQKRPAGGKTAEELQEEEELQLALALSQSEAEHKEKERKSRSHIAPDPAHLPTVSPSGSSVSASPEHGAGSMSGGTELSRYLDRSYWEQRLARDGPTAPAPASHASHDLIEDYPKASTAQAEDDDISEDKEIDEFVESLKSQVEIFVNRMKSNSSRGRSIANDTAVQSLFMNITAMHSRLLKYIQQQDDKRVYLESLQDKVTQIRDSRAALDTLRAEHAARLAAAAEAAERTRQMQMAAKLQAMRKKKHEYLQYQRQLALHKVQEQEREMQMRQEQQKHQYLMSANSYYMPGVAMQQYQSGYPNQAMYGNPQFHPQMMPQATTDGTMNVPGQAQMSQANMQMNPNQIGAMSQSMPQLPNSFPMTTAGAPVSQTISAQLAMNQPNIRQNLGQQLPMQQQMLMQQMHQMRMPVQPGVHQMLPQNMPNGLPQQNGQTPQMPKQNLQNQPQQPANAMMPPMSVGQQNIGQPMINASNAMMGMQVQNMRMPQMQGSQSNANQQLPVSGYPMNFQNQQSTQQTSSQALNIQQSSQHIPGQQLSMPGQPMSLTGQQMMPGQPQGMQIPSHMPPTTQGQQTAQSQGQPIPQQNQMPPGQSMAAPGQSIQPPGTQIMMHGQQMPQGQQMLNQQMAQNQPTTGPGQQISHQMQPSQMQQLPQVSQQLGGQVQHLPTIPQGQALPQSHTMQQGQPMQQSQPMPQGQPMQQGQCMPQGQPMQQNQPMQQSQPMPQGQQMQQGQAMAQGQQMQQGQPPNMGQAMKIQQQNFGNVPPQQNQQAQQAQTPVKSENNNSTAELISFD